MTSRDRDSYTTEEGTQTQGEADDEQTSRASTGARSTTKSDGQAIKPYVLVVDDSLTIRMDLRSALSSAGFLVAACDTIADAQKVLRLRPIALLVLDVLLPDGDGMDLLQEIRADPELHRLRVLLLSTEASIRDRVRGLSIGADEYVGKPYDRAYLVERACALCASAEPDALADSRPRLLGKKILVVDDDPASLEALGEELRLNGNEVILSRSGEEALELLAVDAVDVIVLDQRVAESGGGVLCSQIKAMPDRADIPILMRTASDDPEARHAARAAGAEEVAPRSLKPALLCQRLYELLEQSVPEERISEPQLAAEASSMLDRLVTASGLPSAMVRGIIGRACQRLGIDPRTMTSSDFVRVLPAIRDALGVFYPAEEASRRIQEMETMMRSLLPSSK